MYIKLNAVQTHDDLISGKSFDLIQTFDLRLVFYEGEQGVPFSLLPPPFLPSPSPFLSSPSPFLPSPSPFLSYPPHVHR